MESTADKTAIPPSVAAAVLMPSHEMPVGSQKVEELDFDAFTDRSITVEDLISGMNHMGFQASSIGEAVRIINDMVRFLNATISRQIPHFRSRICSVFLTEQLTPLREHGEIGRPAPKRQYFSVTPLI